MLKRLLASAAIAAGLVVFTPLGAQAQITVPNTLQAGQVIRAAELNTNFTTLGSQSLNRITGGTLEGNLNVLPGVTIAGVDISTFLLGTGEVRSQVGGSASAPAFGQAGIQTGVFFPAAGEVALTLSGTERMRLNASGLTVFGTNLVNTDGKVPALNTTYFASLSGAALTNLNASELTTGTVPDERLGANLARVDAPATFTTLGATAITATSGDFATAVAANSIATTTFRLGTTTTSGFVLTTNDQGFGTWQSPGVATGAVPSGAILMFDTACPSTYTRVAAWDDKFIRGGATYGATGGSDTHTHTVDPSPVGTSVAGSHQHFVDPSPVNTSTAGEHSHGVNSFWTEETNTDHVHNFVTSTDGSHSHSLSKSYTQANNPDSGQVWAPFADASVDSAGAHSHSGQTGSALNNPNAQWHAHVVPFHNTNSGGNHAHTVDIPNTASNFAGDHSHTVDIPATVTTTGSSLPSYITVVFCKKD